MVSLWGSLFGSPKKEVQHDIKRPETFKLNEQSAGFNIEDLKISLTLIDAHLKTFMDTSEKISHSLISLAQEFLIIADEDQEDTKDLVSKLNNAGKVLGILPSKILSIMLLEIVKEIFDSFHGYREKFDASKEESKVHLKNYKILVHYQEKLKDLIDEKEKHEKEKKKFPAKKQKRIDRNEKKLKTSEEKYINNNKEYISKMEV